MAPEACGAMVRFRSDGFPPGRFASIWAGFGAAFVVFAGFSGCGFSAVAAHAPTVRRPLANKVTTPLRISRNHSRLRTRLHRDNLHLECQMLAGILMIAVQHCAALGERQDLQLKSAVTTPG